MNLLVRFENGEEKEYKVSQEFYASIPLNINGTVVTADDKFVDFQV